MNAPATSTLRWSRALVVGLVAFAAGTGAHVSADGLLPGAVGLTALALCCAGGAAMFLARQASTLRLVTLVIGGQMFVHTALAALAGHRGDPVAVASHPVTGAPPAPGPRTGSYFDMWQQANPGADGAAPAVPAWMAHAWTDLIDNPLMAAAHLGAAVLVGLWLSVGERALWAFLALSAAVAIRLVSGLRTRLAQAPLPVPAAAPARRTAWPAERRPRTDVWARGPVRRGPPALLLAL